MELKDRRVVVVGMARSGVAAVRLLQREGALVRAVDEKPMGEVLGVTESRVCQIHTKSILQMRSRMSEPERELA